jgi:hypothetical protein
MRMFLHDILSNHDYHGCVMCHVKVFSCLVVETCYNQMVCYTNRIQNKIWQSIVVCSKLSTTYVVQFDGKCCVLKFWVFFTMRFKILILVKLLGLCKTNMYVIEFS